MSNEFDYIAWIRQQQKPSGLVRVGIGDDLAVLSWPKDDPVLVGVDQVLDGVHFDSTVHSPRAIGRKAMNRNLSDCAAMGCLPAAAVVTVALPKGVGDEYAKELFLGMKEAGEKFDCQIVGGDTGSWPGKLVVTVSILGRSDGVEPVRRNGAKPGDLIYVTGPLGGSLMGRHMTFEPKVEVGRTLALIKSVSAMIDLSDGLSRDLAHICRESGVGALVDAWEIPVHEDAVEMRRDGHSPLEHALHDGEDYELLFTAPHQPFAGTFNLHLGGEDYELLFTTPGSAGAGVFRIGLVTSMKEIVLAQRDGSMEPLEPKSWQHTF
jgi:thiamine-monophosphate kinase